MTAKQKQKRESSPNSVDLHEIFLGLQSQMTAKFDTALKNLRHPSPKGDFTELAWTQLLADYLPKRYQVAKAFVLDSAGRSSEQLDIVIFDRHYSPFLFNQNAALYVPAESVYAVLEVKQFLCKQVLDYAGKKAASVRKLLRTTAPIPHAGGTFKPKTPFPILAGILTLSSPWKPFFAQTFFDALHAQPEINRLDLGCVLQEGAFDLTYPETKDPFKIDQSNPKSALIFFFLHLLTRLQSLGTVPAMDISAYAKALRPK
jgi:hypothetical protein